MDITRNQLNNKGHGLMAIPMEDNISCIYRPGLGDSKATGCPCTPIPGQECLKKCKKWHLQEGTFCKLSGGT